ncbi:MAG: hypothetical protein IJU50_11660, partial [Lachnospiraceae bacterium]|nr:hypothetical protein [Lachnospiraceae bacterium]
GRRFLSPEKSENSLSPGGDAMGNKRKGRFEMVQTAVSIVGIVATVISTIVTCISIWQTAKNNKHQKSNRPDQ